ncbi:hypothetical protein MA20_47670, partial [Bradyrhizobium japonicum]
AAQYQRKTSILHFLAYCLREQGVCFQHFVQILMVFCFCKRMGTFHRNITDIFDVEPHSFQAIYYTRITNGAGAHINTASVCA